VSTSKIIAKHLLDLRTLLKLPLKKSHVARRFLPKQTILILSPHPDDEVLLGTLALRLQQENSLSVINVAVTVGSNPKRQGERRKELARALKLLQWKNVFLSADWNAKRRELAKLMAKHKPSLIIAPHKADRHPAHIKTAEILLQSLKGFTGHIAWAEYWGFMQDPNLLVEVSDKQHLLQVAALECHKGEVARNPYHVRLMGLQIDTVRRGSEWLAQKGAPSTEMLLGQLYRLEKWTKGKKVKSSPAPFATLNNDLTDWLQ
jgi:LmbE family N-acetylglucosaminyl deacetylase